MNRFATIDTGALVTLLLLSGCSLGPARVDVPGIDPEAAAANAIQEYDANEDESISSAECAACPALKGSFDLYDSDQDGTLSLQEIEARLQAMLSSGIGRMPCMCIVHAGGRPLGGATVELVPEPFLGGAIQSGSGITNDRGIAKPSTINAPPGLPGIEFGLYRVRITHGDIEIPAKYNTKTELGFELSPIERDRDTAEFHLQLK